MKLHLEKDKISTMHAYQQMARKCYINNLNKNQKDPKKWKAYSIKRQDKNASLYN